MLKKIFFIFIPFILTGCIYIPADNMATTTSSTPVVNLWDQNTAPSSAQNIALLVPLQGSLASAGQAIKNGFLAAYNNSPIETRPQHINIIDTASITNIQQAYKQALDQDADFIIGPLTKPEVQTLSQSNLSVTTLSLNYLDPNQTAPNNLYQFGLSPFDEARQTAALARQNGYESALIIAPAGDWGQSVAGAFQDQWLALGGKVTDHLFFQGPNTALSNQIRDLLHFQGGHTKSAYSRRQDFDVIFLAASPAVARQVQPLLKFYFAGDIPVYATSLIYSGTPQAGLDNDLNGITFCDIPWIINPQGSEIKLRQRLALFWPSDFKQNTRFYALGADAYYLATRLNGLTNSPLRTFSGATGKLYLNDQHRIVRQLPCAQFQSGMPAPFN